MSQSDEIATNNTQIEPAFLWHSKDSGRLTEYTKITESVQNTFQIVFGF